LCTVLAVVFVAGSSAAALAAGQDAPAGAGEAPPPPPPPSAPVPEPAPAPPPPTNQSFPAKPAPVDEANAQVGANAKEPRPGGRLTVVPDPASVTEVGVQRLPSWAYPEPQTRGLPYGSLWLTFHGLQWPYMPALSTGPRFVVGVSGWGWVDTSYQKFAPWGDYPGLGTSKSRYWKQQARMLLRVTPTYSLTDGWFIQGQAEFVATEDQTSSRADVGGADTDDLWLRIGQWGRWDVQAGRFEGWEVFHLGMALDQNTFERSGAFGQGDVFNPAFYGLTDNQFRPAGAAGNMALHYYPLPFLRVELLGMAGSFSGRPTYATRPVAILDLGWLKLKGGVEYQHSESQQEGNPAETTQKGVGGAVQFVFLPHLEFGLNAAQGTIWDIKGDGTFNSKGSLTRTSVGGFANISNGSAKYPFLIGIGSLYTVYEDQNAPFGNGVVDKYWQLQSFVAIQYVVFQQLYIKLVGGYARGHWITADDDPPIVYDDEMYSLRLRFAMYF
jgi:hypothetical protein